MSFSFLEVPQRSVIETKPYYNNFVKLSILYFYKSSTIVKSSKTIPNTYERLPLQYLIKLIKQGFVK